MTDLKAAGRKFGAEFETIGLSTSKARQVLADAGIDDPWEMGYSGREYDRWQCKEDGSLPNCSAEVVSPILTYGDPDDMRQVVTVLNALRKNGARVNPSCGFHVHVHVADLPGVDRLPLLFATYQTAMDSLCGDSRKNNCYSTPFYPHRRHGYYGTELAWSVRRMMLRHDTTRLDDLGIYDLDQDYGPRGALNMAWYHERGTVEFRQHNGTMLPNVAIHWITLLMGIVHAASILDDDTVFERYEVAAEHYANGDPIYTTLADLLDLFREAEALSETEIAAVTTGRLVLA